jgi:cation transport ATPase
LLLILALQKKFREILRVRAVQLDFVLLTAGVAGVCLNSIVVPTEWFRENIYFFTLIYISLIFLLGDLLKSFRNREAN